MSTHPPSTQPKPTDEAPGPAADVAGVRWDENDTPVSTRFEDPYFSRLDGRDEARHVFLAGNGLPQRWAGRHAFTIAELGFGTGLNFLETLAAWRRQDPRDAALTYVSFEQYPLAADDLARALDRWPDLAGDRDALLAGWPPEPGWHDRTFGTVTLRLGIGDANALAPQWESEADAWYLDGFSPARNPDMWDDELMAAVCAHTAPGGTFATFTAAGWVRRNLQSAGFAVEKVPGYGRKRECLCGTKPPDTA